MRLNRFLARAGAASRRGAETLITSGRVRINGEVVDKLSTVVDPRSDTVELDGRVLTLPDTLTYIALNKPRGYVVTTSDPRGRPTVIDLVDGLPDGVVPVGRLDVDTSGLLLMTDDGELAHRIAHPSFELTKVYQVTARGKLSEESRRRLETGVTLEGRRTSPAVVRIIGIGGGVTRAEMVIHEGGKRQVRRMFDLVGHPVTELRRTQVGPVELGSIETGHWRNLSETELKALREALGLPAA
jgi:23S rRNA pseudouridine2605 synthase